MEGIESQLDARLLGTTALPRSDVFGIARAAADGLVAENVLISEVSSNHSALGFSFRARFSLIHGKGALGGFVVAFEEEREQHEDESFSISMIKDIAHTSQVKALFVIPTSRKWLIGYAVYAKFLQAVKTQIEARDPTASLDLVLA